MKYRLYLFDLDDTLFDFSASNAWSFKQMLHTSGAAVSADSVFADFLSIDSGLWKQFEQGLVSRDQLKVERFARTFAKHGLTIDAEEANHLYLQGLGEHVALIDGAVEVCKALAAVGEVGVITNGFEQVQRQRVLNAGLQPYVSFIASSEACGYAKPDARLFAFAVDKAKAFSNDSTLIIGDRLEADILGGNNFAISSCWFNPSIAQNTSAIQPTYEITHLTELVALVGA
ncbi:YjjG family noncanonical pyrimidine nucleotidase [Paenalcaligenes sp. Me131]|uniref:YjjG family noncanonical pyrimidine nucleotidase n=1 Tax=Paenalcaligenes sp. Me131 TaxID=3392636 RepID=UPI003D2A7331